MNPAEMRNRCTMLVNGYDKGLDILDGFFICLYNNWRDMPLNIVVNTESKSYSTPLFKTTSFSLFQEGKRIPWGKRLIETIKLIDTEYILFLLDDFWLNKPVNEDLIWKTIDYLDNNKDICTFSFETKRTNTTDDHRFVEYVLKDQKCEYKYNCQAGIWRKEKLLNSLRKFESAWDWELYGNYRSFKDKNKYYCYKFGIEKAFNYNAEQGGAIHRGKWNYEYVSKLAEQYNINIDFIKRGFITKEYWDNKNNQKPSSLIQKICAPNFFSRLFNLIRNYYHMFLSRFF